MDLPTLSHQSEAVKSINAVEVAGANFDVNFPAALAAAVNHGTEVCLSKTSVSTKEKERKLEKKKHFPWMDLVNEALDVLWKEKLELCNLKPKLLSTNNQRIIGRHGVAGCMVEMCRNAESMSAVHKARFGNGLVAFQSRLLKNRPVLVQDGLIDKNRKVPTTYPIFCSCCFGPKTKRWNVEDFVVQEIGRITVQLCEVCVNSQHRGQHVGVTLEAVVPHNGNCYLRTQRLQSFFMTSDNTESKGKGFWHFPGRFPLSLITGNQVPPGQRNSWTDIGDAPKMVDRDSHLRLMLFFMQNWGDVNEWTTLEWTHRWPVREEEPSPHLVFDCPKFMFSKQPEIATTHGEDCGYQMAAKLNHDGESVSSSKSLKGKHKPGVALLPLTRDVCIVFKDGRLRNNASAMPSNLCDMAVKVKPMDILTWQGDTMHRWGIPDDVQTPSLVVQCNWHSTLHVDTETVISKPKPDNVDVSMDLLHEVFHVNFMTEARHMWQQQDSNPQVSKWKKDQVLECHQSFRKLLGLNNCGKRKRATEI